jgi:hypothetical protein
VIQQPTIESQQMSRSILRSIVNSRHQDNNIDSIFSHGPAADGVSRQKLVGYKRHSTYDHNKQRIIQTERDSVDSSTKQATNLFSTKALTSDILKKRQESMGNGLNRFRDRSQTDANGSQLLLSHNTNPINQLNKVPNDLLFPQSMDPSLLNS